LRAKLEISSNFELKGGGGKIKFTKESKTKIKIKTIRTKFEKK
jgi:hypothetical protein